MGSSEADRARNREGHSNLLLITAVPALMLGMAGVIDAKGQEHGGSERSSSASVEEPVKTVRKEAAALLENNSSDPTPSDSLSVKPEESQGKNWDGLKAIQHSVNADAFKDSTLVNKKPTFPQE